MALPTSGLVEANTPSLDLENEHAEVRMRHGKVSLAIVGATEFVITDPLDMVQNHPFVVKLAGESFKKAAFCGRLNVAIEKGRIHPSHATPHFPLPRKPFIGNAY